MPANISGNINSIPMLNGSNFTSWKHDLEIILGIMDLDIALQSDCPSLTDASTSDEKRERERWTKSNRICMMIMKKTIPEAFRAIVSDTVTTAKGFLAEIEKRFAKNEKSEISTLLGKLISMKYNGSGNIREYILEMDHITSKLRALKLVLPENLLVHLVLISLPLQFDQLKVSYNCQNEAWSLNQLISHCVQDEERRMKNKTESAHLTSSYKDKGKGKKRQPSKEVAYKAPPQKQQKKSDGPKTDDSRTPIVCFFCGAKGHIKMNCTNYRAWRAKKGMPLSLVCSEVNLTSVPRHTWWIDSGATTHISVSMQGILHCRTPSDAERYIYVGDGKTVQVEAIGKFRLLLKTGFIWILMRHLSYHLLGEI